MVMQLGGWALTNCLDRHPQLQGENWNTKGVAGFTACYTKIERESILLDVVRIITCTITWGEPDLAVTMQSCCIVIIVLFSVWIASCLYLVPMISM